MSALAAVAAPLRVLVASADAGSLITQIRLVEPLTAELVRSQGLLSVESFPYITHAALAATDVLVVQRGDAARQWRLMRAAKAYGAAVIYEIDDLLIDPAPYLLHHDAILHSRVWVQRCLAEADLVTVSTERLKAALHPWIRRAVVIPNAAQPQPNAELPGPQADAPSVVLLASSDNLSKTGLYEALQSLRAQRGARLRVVAVGGAADDAQAAGLDVERFPLMPRESFVAFAHALPNAVAAIPLDSSAFSACKSAIKWFDYAEAGVLTLASALPPYSDVIDPGRTGVLVQNTPESWAEALSAAIDQPAWRLKIAGAARAAVRAHHHAGLTHAAWAVALQQVQTEAKTNRPAPVPLSWLQYLQSGVHDQMVGIRRWNRTRLRTRRSLRRP